MAIFLWMVLGALAWQTITVIAFVISGEKEEAAIYCGGGIPLLVAKMLYIFYDEYIRRAWCRWMAKRYAIITASGELWPNHYRVTWEILKTLEIGKSGAGNYVMTSHSPNYNKGAYRKDWMTVPEETRLKYTKERK